jgi:hypothetical protein
MSSNSNSFQAIVTILVIIIVCFCVFYPTSTVQPNPFDACIVYTDELFIETEKYIVSCDCTGGNPPYTYEWISLLGITSFTLPTQSSTKFHYVGTGEKKDTIFCIAKDYYNNEKVSSFDITYAL